jgi:hypothetical protein
MSTDKTDKCYFSWEKAEPTKYEYMQVRVYVYGEGFKPEDIKLGYKPLELKIYNSTGEIAKTGRYKGQPCPYGHCVFTVPKSTPHEEKINLAVTLVHRLKQEDLPIEDIHVHLFFHGIQGNMELSTEELKDLAGLKTTVCMNYIQEKE